MIYDVIVVGGGPGGATAAGLAASAGLKVLIVNRAVFEALLRDRDGVARAQSVVMK